MEVMFGPKGYINYTLSYEGNIGRGDMDERRNEDQNTVIMHVEAEGYTGTGGC